MGRRTSNPFPSIRTEGGLLPAETLQRIASGDEKTLAHLSPSSYHLAPGERLNEAISRSWSRLVAAWASFRAARERLPETDAGTTLTRERWLLPLLDELGFGRVPITRPIHAGERDYAVSHLWQRTPIHLVSFRADLDRKAPGVAGASRSSPHSLVQELLNRSDDHLWGLVSNGLVLRLLRDNASLSRQAYVELDLAAMMEGELYSDFTLLWLLLHVSRVEAEKPEACVLEAWTKAAREEGLRALDTLRNGVEKALEVLGRGFLDEPGNAALRQRLASGTLPAQDYYRQLLRLVYRLLFLLVAEDRELLFLPASAPLARERYLRYYGLSRLRSLAASRRGSRHGDLWAGLALVMKKLGSDEGCPDLALPPLGGFLFSDEAMPNLASASLSNSALLEAVRKVALTVRDGWLRPVDFRNLGAEELGSVYESLLELHPVLHEEGRGSFELRSAAGSERKTTGSYYTPSSLIECLLDSALDPVLDEALKAADPEKALLALKVCDPACGSGHFLIAAAHRMARRLASVRTGEEEPDPTATRTALRDVIGRCLHGVDLNPMAAELCRVALWIESLEPGKPLSFLDHHIQVGNSLLGTTPALLAKGIPDEAFTPIEGDEKAACSAWRKQNKRERQQMGLAEAAPEPWEAVRHLAEERAGLDAASDASPDGVRAKEERWRRLLASDDYTRSRLLADAWCAAFVWRKVADPAVPPPITEETFRRLATKPEAVPEAVRREVVRLREQYQFFHWHLAFPDVFRVPGTGEKPENEQQGWSGGFDVVLGNPPWERVKLQEQEFFAARSPEIAKATNAAARKRLIAALPVKEPSLMAAWEAAGRQAEGQSHLIRQSDRYPLCGKGDVNTYALFGELNWVMLAGKGRAGFIVPGGIATDDTTKAYFQALVNGGHLASLFHFENEDKVFPGVHHAFRFGLMTLDRSGGASSADLVFYARQVADLSETERHVGLNPSDFETLNPNTRTCPTFRSRRDAEINLRMYRSAGVFVRDENPDGNPWNATVHTRLWHMAEDSEWFRSRSDLEDAGLRPSGSRFGGGAAVHVPLFEAKMLHHFDHRYGTYEGQSEAQEHQGKLPELDEAAHTDPQRLALPYYWVPEPEAERRLRALWDRGWLLCWRDICRSTDQRTLIGVLTPRAAIGHTAPLLFPSLPAQLVAALYANICSFGLDYAVRQKVGGTHITYHLFKQLPILPPAAYAVPARWATSSSLTSWFVPRVLELTYTAWDLEPFARDAGWNGPPFRWDEPRRFRLRCELDAAFFHLYGIPRADVDYIMDTFPIVRRNDEQKHGDYRTKNLILEIYDELQRAIDTGEPFASRLDPPPGDPRVTHQG